MQYKCLSSDKKKKKKKDGLHVSVHKKNPAHSYFL